MESQGLTRHQLFAKTFKPTDATIFKSVEHFPETITHGSYVPQPLSKLVKCGAKHLGMSQSHVLFRFCQD